MRKVAIIAGYGCNNNCIFCYDSEKREKKFSDLTTAQIKGLLYKAKKAGCDYVDFLGGEFTIRPDAIQLISYAKELGFETIALTTNGRLFSYKKVFNDFVSAGLNSVIFSVHGHNKDLHDSLTNTLGSFDQLILAVKNAKEMGMRINTNTTITKQNLSCLPKIGEFLYKLGSRNAEFIFLDPTTGKGNTDFENIMPGIKESAQHIRKLLDIGKRKKLGHWHIRYYPMCYLKGYEGQVSELHEKKTFKSEFHFGPEFSNLDAQNSRKKVGRVKGEQCKDCIYNNSCEGIWKRYAEIKGVSELVPVS